mmetsp:Transcript_2042/g.2096  ORF Transcript_2042/g.2096 Transcript_2042/m.2096 type:complete len:345 (+) Transcript_2042:137-1171(+)
MELSLLCNSEVLLCIVENGKTVLFSSNSNPEQLISENVFPSIKGENYFTTKHYNKFSKEELEADLESEEDKLVDSKNSYNEEEHYPSSTDCSQSVTPFKSEEYTVSCFSREKGSLIKEDSIRKDQNKEIKKALVFGRTKKEEHSGMERISPVNNHEVETSDSAYSDIHEKHKTHTQKKRRISEEENLNLNRKKNTFISSLTTHSINEMETDFSRKNSGESSHLAFNRILPEETLQLQTDLPLRENSNVLGSVGQVTRKVPVKTIIEDDKNVLFKNNPDLPKLILREKLKRDYFGPHCNLSLEEMLQIIKARTQSIGTKTEATSHLSTVCNEDRSGEKTNKEVAC